MRAPPICAGVLAPAGIPCSAHAPRRVRRTHGRASKMTGGLSSSPLCEAIASGGEREQLATSSVQSAAW
eukprot:scaffold35449_cov31-Tisochrysis_lutea.AAC.1